MQYSFIDQTLQKMYLLQKNKINQTTSTHLFTLNLLLNNSRCKMSALIAITLLMSPNILPNYYFIPKH